MARTVPLPRVLTTALALLTLLAAFRPLAAQGTLADYQRSAALAARFERLALDVMDAPHWIGNTDTFWYRKSVRGGHEFVRVDAAAATRAPAFDHARLATALTGALGTQVTAATLPFSELTYENGGGAITFVREGSLWRCSLADYRCVDTGPAPAARTGGRGGAPDAPGAGTGAPVLGPARPDLLPEPQPYPTETPWEDGWSGGADVLEVLQQQAQGRGGQVSESAAASPDGRWEAYIQNYNIYLRPAGTQEGEPLSYDGSEGNFYTLRSVAWSPDSRKLVGYRTIPGYRREVHYVVSSPTDQLQPKDSVRYYQKPGDVVDLRQPVLFDVESGRRTVIDDALFPNAYNLAPAVWWKDSRAFTFEYNQRGHQVYRVIEVDAGTGQARALIDEQSGPDSFIHYSGGRYRYDVADGREIIWQSERDGWQHLYLYDGPP